MRVAENLKTSRVAGCTVGDFTINAAPLTRRRYRESQGLGALQQWCPSSQMSNSTDIASPAADSA